MKMIQDQVYPEELPSVFAYTKTKQKVVAIKHKCTKKHKKLKLCFVW